MNKKYIVRKNEYIQKIIRTGKKIVNQLFIVYRIKNELGFNRFCISVSKKIGNAVVRNKLKRITKDILSKNSFESSYDYVIILRKEVLEKDYIYIRKELQKILEGE